MNDEAKWWHRWLRLPHELRRMGLIGINARNATYMLPSNRRSLYRLVDDKLRTKALATEQSIAIPETYFVLRNQHDIANFLTLGIPYESFVIKPARGSGGKGVLVIEHRDDECFYKLSGVRVTLEELKYHATNILAGLFSLGGQRDVAIIEYRVRPNNIFNDISFQGAPDIRILLYHGYVAMAMMRVTTSESDGRANLHQGAVGIGIDLRSGKTVQAVYLNRLIEKHPDTKKSLIGIEIPCWEEFLSLAMTCHDMIGMGYLGVDMMLDEQFGPMMIEINARPGLSIQMANGVGLAHRLEEIDAQHASAPLASRAEKWAWLMSQKD